MTIPDVQVSLAASGIDFEILACDPALADTHAFCEHYNIPIANSANAILVKSKKGEPRFTLCVLLATHRLDVNHCVKKKLDAKKVSFASAEETVAQTSMEIGGVTPIGLTDELPIWVDDAVMQCDYIILGGGDRSSKIKVSPMIFSVLPNVEMVSDLAYLIRTD